MEVGELPHYIARLQSWQEAIGFDKESHTYTFNGNPRPSVSELMKPLSCMEYGAETGHWAKLAMDRGARAHAAMEALDEIGVYPVEFDTMKYVEAYMAWRDSRPDLEIVCNEKRVCNTLHNYCGTIDKLGWDAKWGQMYLIDIKTGEVAHEDLWQIQMEFYECALEQMGLYTVGSFVVQCKKDGTFVEHKFDGTHRSGLVEPLLEIWRWRNR